MTVKEACGSFACYKEIRLMVEETEYQLARKGYEELDHNMMYLFGDCVVNHIVACEEGRFFVDVKMGPVRA